MKFMQTVDYKYIIKRHASRKIFTFYSNVAKKYRHTYDKEDLKLITSYLLPFTFYLLTFNSQLLTE